MDGFNEVVPLEWVQIFDEKELEVGMPNLVSHVCLCVFCNWEREGVMLVKNIHWIWLEVFA